MRRIRIRLDDAYVGDQIQRSEDDGQSWEHIAVLVRPAVSEFQDYESNDEARPRYRLVRALICEEVEWTA